MSYWLTNLDHFAYILVISVKVISDSGIVQDFLKSDKPEVTWI